VETTNVTMKTIISLIISTALVVSGYAQTRNVLVGTNNAVVSPTNFWSSDASNARAGLGLGTAATNPASAFQPASSALTNLASSNGGALTNITATSIVGVIPSSNIPSVSLTNIGGTLSVASGGTGATNAGGARTNLGLGETNSVQFGSLRIGNTNVQIYRDLGSGSLVLTANANTNTFEFRSDGTLRLSGPLSFDSANYAASTRTNLGLGWLALTNTNTAGFNTSIYGSGTNPVLYNTNGEVVSPTNFWQVAPIATTLQNSTPIVTSTNAATNARLLFLFSLAPSTVGITNTITLPTNGNTFNGDVATITHNGPTSSVTAIRQLGASTNLITLNQAEETVRLLYRNNQWTLMDNISQIEPIYFSGTNASANAAASRTNFGLGFPALTNTDVTNFRAAIGLGVTSEPDFQGITLTEDTNSFTISAFAGVNRTNLGLGATNSAFSVLRGKSQTNHAINLDNAEFEGAWTFMAEFLFDNAGAAAATRTNLGLGLPALTNTNNANFQAAIFATNAAPTGIGGNLGTVAAWIEIVASNGVTYKVPAYTNVP
jgi:hypothetical protein